MKINQITPQEADFTSVLDTIAVKPKMLYYYGKIPKNVENIAKSANNRPKAVAIVGARKNTQYGERVAYDIAYNLAKRGVVIVSGLAFGIDSIAHRAALDAGGITVGILGTPIDQITPRSHLNLAKEIIEKDGAIISEYAPDELTDPRYSFLHRNRLISGLSDAVVVVEAAIKSGSLNTALHALEQGKDLFSVPGDINRPLSAGCNKLIRQGAMPYTEFSDIENLLFPPMKKRQRRLVFGDTKEEAAILEQIAQGVYDGDAIIQNTNLSTPVFNQTISLLEIKGQVRSLGANYWVLQ